jgi:catalase
MPGTTFCVQKATCSVAAKGVQLFDQETADRLPFDHLDSTKLIPEEEVPVRIATGRGDGNRDRPR